MGLARQICKDNPEKKDLKRKVWKNKSGRRDLAKLKKYIQKDSNNLNRIYFDK